MNIKKGDTVMVMVGDNSKDVGRTGKVLEVMPDKERVIVQGRALVIRHTKPRQQGQQGGRIEKESSIHVSNVMLVCPSCKRPTRVGHTFVESRDGKQKKVRVCKNCGKNID